MHRQATSGRWESGSRAVGSSRDDEARARGRHPVVINEQLARQLWPNVADPTGRRMKWSGDTATSQVMTVVGVVRDVRHYGLVDPMRPGLYLSSSDVDTSNFRPSYGIAIRSASAPAAVAAAARAVVRRLDPELPLIELQSAQAAVNRSIANRRTIAFAFAAFGAVALSLALGGIYAVLSYVVGRRRQEIGIRMALGARRGAGGAARRATGAAAGSARRRDRAAARAAGAREHSRACWWASGRGTRSPISWRSGCWRGRRSSPH